MPNNLLPAGPSASHDMPHSISRRAVLAALAAVAATPVRADPSVDLQLVLAIDVSGSVNQTRYELQRLGYAEAFRAAEVLAAIRSGPRRVISVTLTQWTGPGQQEQVLAWRRLGDEADVKAFASEIDAMPRKLFSGGTSISGAIDHAVKLLQSGPDQGARRVIDVSGDGRNNRGRPSEAARDEAVKAGVVINGLPIMALEPDLDQVYRDAVIGGDGSFMVVAESYYTFAAAVRRKLIQEIAVIDRALAVPA